MESKNVIYWQNLKSDFMEFLNTEIPDKNTRKGYSRSIDLLMEYAMAKDEREYSVQLGYAFFEFEKSKDYKGKTTLGRRRATVRHLNQYLYGRTFWQKAPRNTTTYKTNHKPLQCPTQFALQLEEFLNHLQKRGFKEITINKYCKQCTQILCDIAEQGVDCWEDIGAKNLTSAFSRAINKKYFIVYAKRMFGYLFDANIVVNDYSAVLPMLNKRKPVPSVYSPAEVKQLLDSIERFTPLGKRDYAILQIAARLGLRASDIRLLRFDNVDFENATVKFVQFKTSIPNQLPLPLETAEALHDYIDHGREASSEQYIFLNGYGRPLLSHAVSTIAMCHFKQSGLNFGHRKHSSHALRMSFASQLIAENVPYEIVRVALGHASRESTSHYVEFDIESLRICALEVPPPSGLFEKYLTSGGNC